ncbi:MAG: polyphosphate kinase 1 [Saprospiraceae bacterium]
MKKLTEDNMHLIHRDISWLSFNERVMQEAKDPSVPLLERVKFMAIYSSNLGEYFQVRVASLKNLVRIGKKTKAKLDFAPKTVLKKVLKVVNNQQLEFSRIMREELIPQLEEAGIKRMRTDELNEEQIEFIDDFFKQNLLPFVQPVLLVKGKIKPFLNNSALYLALFLQDKEKPDNPYEYALVKVPSDHFGRFVKLPSSTKRNDIIMLDDIVRYSCSYLFPGYNILGTYSIKLTRDAELYIDDEFTGNLLQKIKKSLKKRDIGPPARLVYDRSMPPDLLDFLKEVFELADFNLLPEGRYHNNFDLFQFPSFGLDHLKQEKLPPIAYNTLEKSKDFLASLVEQDHLLHFPYHSYESVIQFFEQAARDPKVTDIKIVQYRVAKKSRIMKALLNAVKAGKKVTAFIEVKARFDEENNLIWGERLENAGVQVHYSFPGLKVHSKIALIRRKEEKKTKDYVFLSTGNFNEDTAKIYGDFGMFTTDKRLTDEVSRVFSFLETVKVPGKSFKHLLVGHFNLREDLSEMIEKETKAAEEGKPAYIMLKMNSLQDPKMILLLYQASQAGVKIDLIIRGICCLIPGIPGVSENIHAISIVDRFLEHARVFIFHNGGKEKMYLSSADFMTRNLSYRIETAFPVYDPVLRQEILDYIEIQFKDNTKARLFDQKQKNEYLDNDSKKSFNAQWETYKYVQKREERLDEKKG